MKTETVTFVTRKEVKLAGADGVRICESSVTPDALIVAFVQGAQWWEYHKTGATMWASDRDDAEAVAIGRLQEGALGKSPNADISDRAEKDGRTEK